MKRQSDIGTKRHSGNASIAIGAMVLGIAGATGAAACGDPAGATLLRHTAGNATDDANGVTGGNGGNGGGNNPSGNGGGGDDDSGSTITDGGVSAESGALHGAAESLFRALQTELVTTCGGAAGVCHVTGAYQNNQTPAWLGGADPYVTVKAYPGAVVRDPYGSKLIVKGPHAGPAFAGTYKALGDKVLSWLTAEASAIKSTPLPTTDPVAIVAGPNTVDIAKGGTGVTGAKLTFTAAISGSILTLSTMQLVAPATTGVHVAHPIFVIVPATGATVEDPVDSFSNLDQAQAAGSTQSFGVGTLILTGWDATAKLSIEFTTLASATVADAGLAGGCKSVATFITNAVPAIQGNTCLNCHNTGGSGFGQLDLSKVGTDNAAACAQALSKVDTANKANSDIILAPTGKVNGHPYKNAAATYTTMMLSWINNE